MAQLVKNLPDMQETWVQSLGWEDPLEKGKTTHSSILAWRIPRTIRVKWCCESAALNMSANLENTAVATGLEKVSFHSNP